MRHAAKMHIIFSSLLLANLLTVSSCTQESSQRQKGEQDSSSVFTTPVGGYTLPKEALLGSCPFVNGTYDINPVLGQIRTLLEAKIDGQNSCLESQRALLHNLTRVQSIYSNIGDYLATDKSIEVYEGFLADLQLRLNELNSTQRGSSVEATNLTSTIVGLQSQVRNLRSESASSRQRDETYIESRSRLELISYLNQTIKSIENTQVMNPTCINQIGGFSSILPPIFAAASVASGTSFFSGSQVSSAAFGLISNLTSLLQNRDAKRALQEIVRVQNEKVLACTYYSIRSATCEIKRAEDLIEKHKDEIQGIDARIYNPAFPAKWQEFLRLKSKEKTFAKLFDDIGVLGSSLSLPQDDVISYVSALAANPAQLLPAPLATAPESEVRRWLDRVRSAGVRYTRTNLQGVELPYLEQLENAITAISNQIGTISGFEEKLISSKSFHEIKDMFEKNQSLRILAADMKSFLVTEAQHIPGNRLGAIHMIIRTMNKVVTFADTVSRSAEELEDQVQLNPPESDEIEQVFTKGYLTRIELAGLELFREIALGSVAQLNRQEVFAIGSKTQNRLETALQVVENKFISDDQQNSVSFDQSYLAFKQNRLLFFQLSSVYNDLKTTSATFNGTDSRTARSSFEVGFKEELLGMVESFVRLPNPSSYDVQAATRICSLFGPLLSTDSSRKAKDLLRTCKASFNSLKIETIHYSASLPVNFEDGCFFSEFVKTENAYKVYDWIKRQGSTSQIAPMSKAN